MRRGPGRFRVGAVLALLVVMHFIVRPWLGNPRWAPDFLLLALMFYAIRARPGRAAVAGFAVGVLADALAETAFGAGALAHTVLGYLLAWGKAVFFPEALLVNAGFFFVGAWVRDLLVLLAAGHLAWRDLLWQVSTWSLLQAAATTLVGVAVLLVFRDGLRVSAS